MIGYFGVNAYTGNRGLRPSRTSTSRSRSSTGELAALKAERASWERRVALLRAESLDPDMLDERARALLDYVDPRDLTLRLSSPEPPPAPTRPRLATLPDA